MAATLCDSCLNFSGGLPGDSLGAGPVAGGEATGQPVSWYSRLELGLLGLRGNMLGVGKHIM